jgi:6,7-dimethyl-8-ribityllumazine synthase
LVKGAAHCFVRHGGDENDLTLVRVPGANEVPQIVQKLAMSGKLDAWCSWRRDSGRHAARPI